MAAKKNARLTAELLQVDAWRRGRIAYAPSLAALSIAREMDQQDTAQNLEVLFGILNGRH